MKNILFYFLVFVTLNSFAQDSKTYQMVRTYVAPHIDGTFEVNSFEAIEQFVGEYIDLLRKYPFIPMFILGEVNKKDTHFVVEVMKGAGVKMDIFKQMIEKDKKMGLIKKTVDHRYLLIYIMSLCVFPVIGRPLLEVIVFENDSDEYNAFLDDRKRQVTDLILHSISTGK